MEPFIKKDSSAYWRAIAALFFGSVVAFGAEYCLQPVIPVLAHEFELMPATASLAMSFGTVGMACSMLVIAGIAGRLERKKTMTVAITIASLLAILMAVCGSFEIILGMRLLQGILLAGFPALAVAYINEEFDPKIVGLVIGIYISGSSIGGLAGRLFISTATDFFSWRVALMAVGAIYFVIGVLFWFGLPSCKRKLAGKTATGNFVKECWELLKNKKLVAIYLIAFAVMGSFVCTYNYISYVFMAPPYELSQTAIGFIFMVYLVGTVSSTVMGGMSDRYGNGSILCVSCLIMLAGILVTSIGGLWIKIVGLALFTYGFFAAHSVACSWAGKVTPTDKARDSAMYMLFYYMGASVVGTIGGAFLTRYGWSGVVCFVSAMILCALLISLRLTLTHVPAIHPGLYVRKALKRHG